MDLKRQESQLEIARRYVRDGEERIARLNDLIAETRALAKPTDELEDLLARYRDWLDWRPLRAPRRRLAGSTARSR